MRIVLILAVCALLTAGCSGSDDRAAQQTASQPTTTETPPETQTTPSDIDSTSPHSYRDVIARLPPFDEPASPEVASWRRAMITAFFEHCGSRRGGATKRSFVAANRAVLNAAARFPGATLVREVTDAKYDGNGCRGGSGPSTSFTTYRRYRLPEGTNPERVLDHYQRQFYGWVAASSTAACERTFGQGPAYVVVNACNGVLRVSVRARAPVQPEQAAPAPPRPLGLQYPLVKNHSRTPKPTAFESAPGATCERIRGSEVPSIIIPPPPGVSAEIHGGQLVVEWTLGTVHGDCPPGALILSPSKAPRDTFAVPVHAASGVARVELREGAARPRQLIASTLSVDEAQSRTVSVLVRVPS